MPKLLCVWLFAAIWGIGLHAQQGTDFSGSWVLESSSASSEEIPGRLTVRQPVTTTNALGKPMPPAYLTLDVTRHFANTIQQATYRIGLVGGVVGGLPGSDTSSKSSDWSVRWIGDSLWIHERTSTPSAASASERTETWRLDDAGKLNITLEIRGSRIVDVRRWTLAYRRESK